MPKLTYCEHCGGAESGTTEFVVFHCLSFCSPDCRDEYRAIDEEHREVKRAMAALATVAEVMRRDRAAARPSAHKPVRKRAA